MNNLESAIERTIRGQRDPMAARGCAGKLQHATIEAAKKQAKLMHKKHKARFEAYVCRYCGAFHVGHA